MPTKARSRANFYILCSILTFSTAFAQTESSVNTPEVVVGATYTFESEILSIEGENSTNKSPKSVFTRKITNIDGFIMAVETTYDQSEKKRVSYYDTKWGYIGALDAGDSGVIFSPALQYFDFPLSVGKSWTSQSTETNKKTGHKRIYTINATVEGWERVQVPAGEFDGLKIVLNSEIKDEENVSYDTDISWYVPSVCRSVKSEVSGKNASTGLEEKRITQLISYEIPHDRIVEVVDTEKSSSKEESPKEDAVVQEDLVGPKIKGFQLGMSLASLRKLIENNFKDCALVNSPINSNEVWVVFNNDELLSCYFEDGLVNYYMIWSNGIQKLFSAKGDRKGFLQAFINAYNIPELENTGKHYEYKDRRNGWEILFWAGGNEIEVLNISFSRIDKQEGFDFSN